MKTKKTHKMKAKNETTKKNARLMIRIDKPLLSSAKQAATAAGMDFSQYVRAALNEKIKKSEK